MDKNYTGNTIRYIRINRGKSVEEIQEELNKMGFTRFAKHYVKIENRGVKVYAHELPAICEILGVSAEQLYKLATDFDNSANL